MNENLYLCQKLGYKEKCYYCKNKTGYCLCYVWITRLQNDELYNNFKEYKDIQNNKSKYSKESEGTFMFVIELKFPELLEKFKNLMVLV